MNVRVITAVIGCAIALAACAGAPPSTASIAGSLSSPTEEPSATSTATSEFCINEVEEVEAALEVDIANASATEIDVGGGCSYTDASGTPIFTISVVTAPEVAREGFEDFASDAGAEEISGIGDAAVALPIAESVGVAFIKRDVFYSMGVVADLPMSRDEIGDATEDLARAAADRL